MKKQIIILIILLVSLLTRHAAAGSGIKPISPCNAFAILDNIPPPPIDAINAAENYNFAKGGQTLVIMYNGRILRESYANGGNKDRVQLLASASKGFTGMIGAIAAHDGIIALDSATSEVLYEWKNDPQRSLITYRHLLNMSSGLEELHDQKTWEDFLMAKAIFPPGSTFIYGPDPNIFGLALQRKLGGEKVEAYMNRRLFQPLGIRVEWRGDFEDGNPQLSGGAYVRANEWIKFGEFVRLMFEGTWKGPQILSEQFFVEIFKSAKAHPAYGFYWWLKEPVSDSLASIIDRNNKDQFTRQIKPIVQDTLIPDDFVMAKGAYEQQLYIIPSLKLTVVRNGPPSEAGKFKDTEFLDLLLNRTPTTIIDKEEIPSEFILNQNYPNPFNPSTVISYQISDFSHVSLKVFDILGREVITLVDEYKMPGTYSSKFKIRQNNGGQVQNSQLSSGVYLYQLKSGNYIQTKKMMVLQ